jgi:TolA-binding protein
MKQNYVSAFFLAVVMGGAILHAEPSVYGFGNSNSVSSKPSISPKQMILQNRKTILYLKRKVAEQDERIDGLTSIIEGLSATLAQLQAKGGNISGSAVQGGDNTALLKELGMMIDRINDNYVSKQELQKILKQQGKTDVPKKKPKAKTKTSLEGKPAAKLYSEGVRLFVKKRYSEAKKRFEITDTKGYKPAASNYYLGEIAYYTKQYEDAIFYFKKSAGLYDQASYIDTLLLHTAISLDKNGDKAQARVFYENIIENYPGKKTAKIAKERLKKL